MPRELSGAPGGAEGRLRREKRGYWHQFWDEILLLDPDFFEAYTQFSSVPWVSGTLEPKVKELIYTAFDVSATHLYVPGLRLHIKNAIGYGATREEMLEVIELASVIGIHSVHGRRADPRRGARGRGDRRDERGRRRSRARAAAALRRATRRSRSRRPPR